ncbi:MAG: hypothetical protein GC185_00840 [Alphaproteobacteria bacterium]|nr:hypothetical protein [Alphaproteobacteria bacterium]
MAFISSQKNFIKAARDGDLREVRYCLTHYISRNFSINNSDKDGKTALHHAAEQGHNPIIVALMVRDADATITDKSGTPPLISAIDAGQHGAVKTMLGCGADPNVHTDDYVYPLHKAAFLGDFDSVKALLDTGANIDACIRANSRTALHWAADKGYADVAAALLDAGASLDILDSAGHAPLTVAKKKNNPQIVRLIEAAMAARAEKAPTPQPAPVFAAQNTDGETQDKWVLTGGKRVAHISACPEINRKLTEIFNFESRERLTISENLKTGAESMTPPASFDTLGDETLAAAFKAYQNLGGKSVTEAEVFRNRLMKAPLPPAKND